MGLRYQYIEYKRYKNGEQVKRKAYYQKQWQGLSLNQIYCLANKVIWQPAIDIHEMKDYFLIKAELAGMEEDDIEVLLYEDALIIQGERNDDHLHDESISFQEAQIHYGPFRAEIFLPKKVAGESVNASYKNGFLYIHMSKEPDRS